MAMADFGEKLDSFDIIGRAWKSAALAWFKMPAVFLVAAIFSLGTSLAGQLALSGMFRPGWVSGYGVWVWGGAMLSQWVASAFALAFVAIAVHRFILLNETATAQSWKAARLLRFVGWLMMFQVFGSIYPFGFRWPLLVVVLAVGFVIATVRLLLIFPALAVDDPAGLAAAWNRTQRQFWRIVAALVVSLAPLTILDYAVALAHLGRGLLSGGWFTPMALAMGATSSLLMMMNATIAAAVASWVYWDVARRP